MPFLLRKIRNGRWHLENAKPYLDQGELPAEPLGDLNTIGNQLSVWLVDDEKANLDDVIVALASTVQRCDNLDYALIAVPDVVDLGITVAENSGQTPAKGANHWHRDLSQLSASKVVALAHVILPKEDQRDRVPLKEVKKLLREALAEGKLDSDALQETLLKQLSKG